MTKEEMKDRIARAEEIQQYTENRCTILEKENAGLRHVNSVTLSQLNLYNGELIIELIKAKEIIRELLSSCFGYNSKTVNYEVKAKTEAFLKE